MNISIRTFICLSVIFAAIAVAAVRVYAAEISEVTIASVDDSSATVTWNTDGPTDGLINYGLDAAVGVVRDSDFTKKIHKLTIENLDPSTTYHFRVVSADEAGNKNATAGFVFSTKGSEAAKAIKEIKKIKDPEELKKIIETVKEVASDLLKVPSIIGSPKVTVEGTKVVVKWSTDREAGSVIELQPDSDYDEKSSDPYSITQGDSNDSTKVHEVEVIGLLPATVYHFRVRSEDTAGLTGLSEDDTFRTKSALPEITNIKTSRIQENSATITWNTPDVKAKGLISYKNLRTKATKSAGVTVFSTTQKVILTGLEFGTRYQAIVTATNEAGDNVDSKPFTFVTVRDVVPPEITKVSNVSTLFPDNDAKVQTIISWATDEPSYCQVFYTQGLVKKTTGDDDSLIPEANPVTAHLQVIVGFSPGAVYKFWLKCHDEATNDSQSDDFVLITPTKEQSIIDVILANFQGTFGWVGKVGKK